MLLRIDTPEQKQKILAVILCMELYCKKEAHDIQEGTSASRDPCMTRKNFTIGFFWHSLSSSGAKSEVAATGTLIGREG
jgi:hypothetical protein